MAKKPTSVEIRSYQVGFGDCFLLSFIYDKNDKRHVLIDFGTGELPKRGKPRKPAKPSEHMPKVAEQIHKDSGGKLIAVIATHRHSDHISGFGTDNKTGKSGKIIAGLKPKVVIQPWTEDPKAAKDATHATKDSQRSAKGFIAGLAAMHSIAEAVLALTEKPPIWMGAALVKELRFLGMDNIRNLSAIKNLIAMGEVPGAKAVWARHGSNAGLGRLLPGVKVHVLGPPSLVQSQKIRKQRSRDADQFWHLLAGPLALRDQAPLAWGLGQPGRAGRVRPTPPEGRWFRDRLQRMRGEQLLEIVRSLDAQMNNTSLILLFEVGGKKLLFPGDAQIENWSYAIKDASDRQTTRKLLADVDVYKVGHHGSLNATPKKLLWERFTKRGSTKGNRLTTVLSTMPGKHGSSGKKTEVPRRTLLDALDKESDLLNTDDLKFGAEPEMCQVIKLHL
ncbi:MAG: MBL fold metallo-hydrolase [Nitrospirota bacterium]